MSPCRRACIASLALLVIAAAANGLRTPRHRPEATIYVTRIPTRAELAARFTGAKYEPEYGCYLGAFIDFDATLKHPYRDSNGIRHQQPFEFESRARKQHAIYFFYLGYGRRLPLDWVRRLAAQGKFVQIALEPNDGLSRVRDDTYLRQLADDIKSSGARIFLRFASEMNGPWTNYHRNPRLYRQKFRLVHDVMRRRAPNVAMVWCPYMEPIRLIDRYYPGDDATDWVGVNMYSVTYHNDQLSDPSEREHPTDLLRYVYDRYAARKPMMICEYGATHYASIERHARSEFAARKILTLYAALPRIFPRVKAINYFDGNALAFASDRAYNDYSVTNDPVVMAAYRSAISPAYFIGARVSAALKSDPPPASPMPLRAGARLHGRVRLSCWARTPSDMLSVRYYIDGCQVYAGNRPDEWGYTWNSGTVKPGPHTIMLHVLRQNGRLAAHQTVRVIVAR